MSEQLRKQLEPRLLDRHDTAPTACSECLDSKILRNSASSSLSEVNSWGGFLLGVSVITSIGISDSGGLTRASYAKFLGIVNNFPQPDM